MQIRPEQPNDISRIRELNRAAFGSPAEATLVDVLRDQDRVLSLVADQTGTVVGHIMFSPVLLTSAPSLVAMGLAPMAVAPGHQRLGIGSLLVRAGLDECRARGVEAVFVVGHSAYYPRFGFEPASRFGISCQFTVPDEVFMATELVRGALNGGGGGVLHFHDAFKDL